MLMAAGLHPAEQRYADGTPAIWRVGRTPRREGG